MAPQVEIAVARRSARTVPRMSARLAGIIVAAPTACAMRPTTNNDNVGAMAHAAELAVKMAVPARKTDFAPKRCASQPAISMREAIVTL